MKTVAMKTNRYGDGVEAETDVLVTGSRSSFPLVAIGGIPEGGEGRKVEGGPKIPGPWPYSYGCALVIDGTGTTSREREQALKIELGESFEIEGMPGTYRFEEARDSSSAPILTREEAADDGAGEDRFWDQRERRNEIMGFEDGPPDAGEPADEGYR